MKEIFSPSPAAVGPGESEVQVSVGILAQDVAIARANRNPRRSLKGPQWQK